MSIVWGGTGNWFCSWFLLCLWIYKFSVGKNFFFLLYILKKPTCEGEQIVFHKKTIQKLNFWYFSSGYKILAVMVAVVQLLPCIWPWTSAGMFYWWHRTDGSCELCSISAGRPALLWVYLLNRIFSRFMDNSDILSLGLQALVHCCSMVCIQQGANARQRAPVSYTEHRGHAAKCEVWI